MNKILPQNSYLLVEIFDKAKKKTDHTPFIDPTTSNNLGIVKYSSESEYPIDSQVYFGDKYTRIMVGGTELLAIKTEDIIAKVVSFPNGKENQ